MDFLRRNCRHTLEVVSSLSLEVSVANVPLSQQHLSFCEQGV